MLSLVSTSTWPDTWHDYVNSHPATLDHALDRVDLALCQSRTPGSGLQPLAEDIGAISEGLQSALPQPALAAKINITAMKAHELALDEEDIDAACMLSSVAETLTRPRAA